MSYDPSKVKVSWGNLQFDGYDVEVTEIKSPFTEGKEVEAVFTREYTEDIVKEDKE